MPSWKKTKMTLFRKIILSQPQLYKYHSEEGHAIALFHEKQNLSVQNHYSPLEIRK